MPRFAANIGDGWLYSNLPFLDRIAAASKDGFSAVECADTLYKYDASKIKAELDKYGMKWVLLNTHSMPQYETRSDRKFHAIYPDEQELFKQTLLRAFRYSMVLNKEMCVHIDVGQLTKHIDADTARKQFVANLKVAQKLLDDDKQSASAQFKDNRFTLVIEPVNNIKGRGIENYYLWSQHEALSIIEEVNSGYTGDYPIYLQFDFYHAQTHHGDIMSFLQKNIKYIRHIQASQCPLRTEPCNSVDGDLNYNFLYSYLDKQLKYAFYLGLEYRPSDKANTSKGLHLDNHWFQRFNITDMNAKEKEDEKESVDEDKVANLVLNKALQLIENSMGKQYSKQRGLKLIDECHGDLFLLVSKLNFSKTDTVDDGAPIDNYQLNLQ